MEPLTDKNHLPDTGSYDIPCLILKPKWLSLVLSGRKTLEIRGCAAHKKQWIGLIESGTHFLYGFVFLSGCRQICDPQQLWQLADRHCILPEDIKEQTKMPYRKTYGWNMENPVSILPVRLPAKPGAVIWENHVFSMGGLQRL